MKKILSFLFGWMLNRDPLTRDHSLLSGKGHIFGAVLCITLMLITLFYPFKTRAAESAVAETRYCGTPDRDDTGKIKRSRDAIKAFKELYPCPKTGASKGACPGWQIDHVIPLAVGGCDSVSNMQWLPVEIKTCSLSTGVPCKDRWEREVYKR